MIIKLNKLETLTAIIAFLKYHYDLTKPDDTGLLFQSLLRMKNKCEPIGEDIIFWNDWEECGKIFDNQNKTITEEQAFEIMISFLEHYFNRSNSDDIRSVLGDLLHSKYGETSDPGAWYDWQESLNKAKID